MKPIKYETELEMAQGAVVLANFDGSTAKELGRKIEGRTVYITGMGSSLLFPATNAKRRAEVLLPEQRVEIGYTPNLNPEFFPKNAYVFLSSNSGKTVEILEMVGALITKGIDFFGVTTNPDSPLAKACGKNLYVLQGPFEKGVAATKSIIEQGLFYEAVVYSMAGKEFPISKGSSSTKKVVEVMQANFNAQLEDRLTSSAVESDSYYWIDHNRGIAEELALKSCEIAGKRGIYESGTQILHGRGEVIKPGDLIFIVNPQAYRQKDLDELAELSGKTGSKVVVIGQHVQHVSGFEYVPAQVEDGFEGYCILPVGWNVLRDIGKAMERDIDHPEVAQKARVEKGK